MSTTEMLRPRRAGPAGASRLTRREVVVLRHLAEDATLQQIAARLFVSRNTVKSQVRSLYRKLGVSRRTEAVAWARSSGAVPVRTVPDR
ncbi:response regulator transcription factor [Actinotalea sp. K2]|uniref:response regulator transcription factor n=1 Tax=Actinotalea sp. K2 TaxID=2939438 RepID=UPI002016D714|nr:LuxR C-terminal-related transcriptional regulator [Actinotalea sp. K2]MCL3861615.1 LuxR C-terminal-related transcriptional regulator [Actinotalea sp. K2]